MKESLIFAGIGEWECLGSIGNRFKASPGQNDKQKHIDKGMY